MSTRTYDPFTIERPELKLGEHGKWELGEMHDTRVDGFNAARDAFYKLADDDDAKVADAAALIGSMIAVMCINADEAKDILVGLCDVEKHGEDALGVHALRGISQFLSDYAHGEDLAGNF